MKPWSLLKKFWPIVILSMILGSAPAVAQTHRFAALDVNNLFTGDNTFEGTLNYCSDVGSTDAYACSFPAAIAAYVPGAVYHFKANTTNTGAATLALSGLTPKSIKKWSVGSLSDLADNDIGAGQLVTVVYDGTYMVAQSLGGGGGSHSGIGACAANTWASTLNADSAPTCTQPSSSNLSDYTNVALYNNGSKTWGNNAAFTWTFNDDAATSSSIGFSAGDITITPISGRYTILNGDVGVGIATPSQALHVYRGATASYLRVEGATDGTNFAGLELKSVEATPHTWQFVQKANHDFKFAYYDGSGWSTPFLVQAATGNVGIGTSTPGAALTVYRSTTASYLRLQGDTDGDNYSALELWNVDGSKKWQFASKATTADFKFAYYNGASWSSPFYIQAATGYVGIGNVAPGKQLDVTGDVRASLQLISSVATGTAPLAVSSTTKVANLNADAVDGVHLDVPLPTANGGTGTATGSITGPGALTFAAGGSNQNVTLTPSGAGYTLLNGNVGIGTTTPGLPLDIVGGAITLSGTAKRSLRFIQDKTDYRGVGFGYDTAGQIGVIYADTPGPASSIAFWTYDGGSWAERMRIGGVGSRLTYLLAGLPVYANNAAAIAGGLTAGTFYRTNADPDPICVVH